jgi:ribosomal protein S3
LNIQRYMLVQLIADLIAIEITSHHKHKRTLRSINSLFNEVHPKHILGYKFLLDGKINGRMKTNLQVFKFKNKDTIPIQEFNKRVLYALSVARTYTGLFGIHVWLYY